MAEHGDVLRDAAKPKGLSLDERKRVVDENTAVYEGWYSVGSYKDDKGNTLYRLSKYAVTEYDFSDVTREELISLAVDKLSTVPTPGKLEDGKLVEEYDMPSTFSVREHLDTERKRVAKPKETFEQALERRGKEMQAAGKSREEITAWLLEQMGLGGK